MEMNNSKSIGAGTALGAVGMSAYFIPVTKNRFVRAAYNINKGIAEDKIELLNKAADEVQKKNIKPETKLLLKELGVSETLESISDKCLELKKSFTDDGLVKAMKTYYADNFKNFKKSESSMDAISSKAFSKIRWTNLGWGAFIGFILGNVLSSGSRHASMPQE